MALLPQGNKKFHLALAVKDLEQSITFLEGKGVKFSNKGILRRDKVNYI